MNEIGRLPRRGFDDALSLREEEVVRLAREGRANKEISQLLGLSERTVEGHVRRALEKLGLQKLDRRRAPRRDRE